MEPRRTSLEEVIHISLANPDTDLLQVDPLYRRSYASEEPEYIVSLMLGSTRRSNMPLEA